jgi:outer membrane protein insertion porin family
MTVFFKLKSNNYFLHLNIILFIAALSFSFVTISNKAHSQESTVSSIIVIGNTRISTETIINISKINPGNTYTSYQLNSALQNIKKSTFFKSANISLENNILTINVIENPTINSISFEGNIVLKDTTLDDLILSKERQTLSISKTEKDAEKIASSYANSGRISAIVEPKIIELSDNRVDLVFEINEGRITEVEKITFAGNRAFSDYRLRGIIATKQAGILRKFIKSDTYDEDKLNFDKDLLNNFYLSKGYIDFNVKTSVELTRSKDAFLINYSISEGQKYSYGNITFDISDETIDKKNLQKLNKIKFGKVYDQRLITKLIEEIDIYLSKNGFNFVAPIPVITRNDKDFRMDVEIQLQKTNKLFVERIELEGNSTTLDEVIRLQFDFVEGDPFNRRKVIKAVDKIRGLGFFSTVDTNTRMGTTPEQIIIEVNLIEKPTGSFGIGAGFNSSDGSEFTFNINERNFLGRGQTVKLDLTSSKIEQQTTIALQDPSFLGRNLLAGISFGQTSSTPNSTPLKTERLYFAPKIGFPLSRNSDLRVTYKYNKDDITATSDLSSVSPLISADIGKRNKSSIILSYNLDKTNSVVSPTAGYDFRLTQELNGLGGDINFSKSEFNFKTYKTLINDDIILSSNISSGIIIGTDADISNRFFLGGDRLKGFRNQGIGPIDGNFNNDPLGGKVFSVISLEASFPIGIPEEYGIFGGVFIDSGSLWELDNTDNGRIDDRSKIRSAAGFSIFWDTLIGPLRFNFSRPIKKESYDVIENFRFTVDTRF